VNFTPDMLAKVLAGEKTQTRRPIKPGEKYTGIAYMLGSPGSIQTVKDRNGRLKWRHNNSYAIAPGRGKHAVGRIIITNIRIERPINISDADARAEGFDSKEAFWDKLRELYGPNTDLTILYWALTFSLVQS
jgi:hypothetical protein